MTEERLSEEIARTIRTLNEKKNLRRTTKHDISYLKSLLRSQRKARRRQLDNVSGDEAKTG